MRCAQSTGSDLLNCTLGIMTKLQGVWNEFHGNYVQLKLMSFAFHEEMQHLQIYFPHPVHTIDFKNP